MAGETLPCAYCRRPTPPERQAAPAWNWPGRGRVTNCLDCAGYVNCTECGTLFDDGERRNKICLPCQGSD